jgi:hypothetical protein
LASAEPERKLRNNFESQPFVTLAGAGPAASLFHHIYVIFLKWGIEFFFFLVNNPVTR